MAKNIVVCCDGTGNKFGLENSNVVKLYRMLKHDSSQVTYYHPGVGTMGARNALSKIGKIWTQLLGAAFGYGLSENIADAYQFLMRNYQPGDKIYVFGFSRGAYTARALCGMLYQLGLMTNGNEGQIPYAIRLLKGKINLELNAEFKKTFSNDQDCPVHFIGVWDTVSSVGWVYNAVTFPSTTNNPQLKTVRHAISIDERRAFFRQNLFSPAPHQDVEQVWFPGVHSDVGGSYPEDESQLSKGALEWMVCEAERAELKVNADVKAAVLGGQAPYVKADATGKLHKSLKGLWWIAEVWPKLHRKKVGDKWRTGIRFNLGRRRRPIPDGSLVHVSVEQRMNGIASYRPKNLCPPADLRTKYKVVADRCQAQAAGS
jgi:uncharacterized protein (DUF2235 family)